MLCCDLTDPPTAGRTVCSVCGSTLDGWHCPKCDKPGMPIPPRAAPGPSDPDLPDPPPHPRPQPPTGPHHPKPEPIPAPHRAAGGAPPYYCDRCGSGPHWNHGTCYCGGSYVDLDRALLTLVVPRPSRG